MYGVSFLASGPMASCVKALEDRKKPCAKSPSTSSAAGPCDAAYPIDLGDEFRTDKNNENDNKNNNGEEKEERRVRWGKRISKKKVAHAPR
jgi:hypothetical protein